MNKRYVVRLTAEEREQIERLLRAGEAHARKLLYGRVLLKADADRPVSAGATRGSPRLSR
jgi:hypothetical protein